MSNKKKQYGAQFKAKVALEPIFRTSFEKIKIDSKMATE
jgi:hypothetical protein